jgi:hypothetical protein
MGRNQWTKCRQDCKRDGPDQHWVLTLLLIVTGFGLYGLLLLFWGAAPPCSWHGMNSEVLFVPLPFAIYYSKEVLRILLLLRTEAVDIGGSWYAYYRAYPPDRNDGIFVLLFGSWAVFMWGWLLLCTPPPLPPNCEFSGYVQRNRIRYDYPCQACCACKILSRRVGLDSTDRPRSIHFDPLFFPRPNQQRHRSR